MESPAAVPRGAPTDEFLPFTRPCIDEETIRGVAEVLRSGWITSGPQVLEFERQLSEYCGGRPVRVLSSATGALEIALAIAGIGPGDEVITTPLTWVGTANVIVRAGARPVFVDVDPHTRNIDLSRLEAAVGPATRALLPVDLAGLPVPREPLYAIAHRHGLRVIEDAAQSLGASSAGQRIGTSGDLVAFSFHANKNLTTAEGGCLVVNDGQEARSCELWRLQGVERFADGDLDATLPGGKHNMTDVAARLGLGLLIKANLVKTAGVAAKTFYCPSFAGDLYHYYDSPANQWPPISYAFGHGSRCRMTYSVRGSFWDQPVPGGQPPAIVSWGTTGPFYPLKIVGGKVASPLQEQPMFKLSQLKNRAIVSDLMAAIDRVIVAHKTGINALYSDGSVKWNRKEVFKDQFHYIGDSGRNLFWNGNPLAFINAEIWNNLDAQGNKYPDPANP
jgi:hypothetical protein